MKQLEQELDALRSRVIEMGSLTQSMVSQTIDAVTKANTSAVSSVFDAEERLDQMQVEIDSDAIRVMTVYSPVAGDLRLVLSVSRVTAELERIGDHATNMCETLRLMTSRTDARPLAQVVKMAGLVKEMLSDALTAFGQRDAKKAMATIACDDLVDALNDQIVKELLEDEVRETSGKRDVGGSLSQILIASSLERIADQATNISEEVVYMVEGSDIRHTASR